MPPRNTYHVGRTLGEALMVAGALMTDTPVVPIHKIILKRLRYGRLG